MHLRKKYASIEPYENSVPTHFAFQNPIPRILPPSILFTLFTNLPSREPLSYNLPSLPDTITSFALLSTFEF